MKHIDVVYFSPTGNTYNVAQLLAQTLSAKCALPIDSEVSFTLSHERAVKHHFDAESVVIVAMPVYAGRIPNKIMPYVVDSIKADGALAVPVVCYGNRNYGDALKELKQTLLMNGFNILAAAAVVTNHVFSDKIAYLRPNDEDKTEIARFADDIVAKMSRVMSKTTDEIGDMSSAMSVLTAQSVDVTPLLAATAVAESQKPYYQPLREDGTPANFLKAKPLTSDACNQCGACAKVCPMGSIALADVKMVSGICIKCYACVKVCPVGAKYFDDADLLSHIKMLEQNYTTPNTNVFEL